jgi:hypothetical protein
MSNPRWRRKLALQVCAGALAAGAGYYGGDLPSLSLLLRMKFAIIVALP